jgi:hypothetical protein
MICLSSVDMKTPAHIHYAARCLRSGAPHAKCLEFGRQLISPWRV